MSQGDGAEPPGRQPRPLLERVRPVLRRGPATHHGVDLLGEALTEGWWRRPEPLRRAPRAPGERRRRRAVSLEDTAGTLGEPVLSRNGAEEAFGEPVVSKPREQAQPSTPPFRRLGEAVASGPLLAPLRRVVTSATRLSGRLVDVGLGADTTREADVLPASRSSRLLPHVTVAAAVAFGLWSIACERVPVAYPNDSSVHSLTVAFSEAQLRAGHFPLDAWFPNLSLGSPFLMHYQSAPALIGGIIGLVFGPAQSFAWLLYLLLAGWPIALYASARLLGWDRWAAAATAACGPFLMSAGGYGFEHESYLWLGSGLWPQLFAMWTLPLAWGFAWRAITERRHMFAALVTVALTIAFHFLTAYLLGLTIVLWVLLTPRLIVRRAARAATFGIGALLATLWVTVPLVLFAKWSAANEFIPGTFWMNSYGARIILGWLVHGQIYDSGRFPVVTILVAIGLVVCLRRFFSDERCRALVLVWLMSLLLYFGETTWGSLIDVLPLHGQLLLHRYIMGVHLSGLFLAGVGLAFIGRTVGAASSSLVHRAAARAPLQLLEATDPGEGVPAPAPPTLWRGASARVAELVSDFVRRLRGRRWATRSLPVFALFGIVLVLFPAWHQIADYDHADALDRAAQLVSDQTNGVEVQSLLNIAKSRGPGRVYAGNPGDGVSWWGHNFDVGSVPLYIYMTDIGADQVGFTLRTYSLMNGPEVYFDESNPADYELFGVRYLLMPTNERTPVPAAFVAARGTYALYELPDRGYLQVVDTSGTISDNATDVGASTRAFLDSSEPSAGRYPTVAFDGAPAAPASLQPGEAASGPPGRVVDETDDLARGALSGTVVANRPAVVLAKVSYDPGWQVTVDGRPATTEMLAPALLGVAVGSGVHTVAFRYVGYQGYGPLAAIAVLVLLAWGLAPRWWRRYLQRRCEPALRRFAARFGSLRDRRRGHPDGAVFPAGPIEEPDAETPQAETPQAETPQAETV